MPPRTPDDSMAAPSRRGFLARLAALVGGGVVAGSAPNVFATPADIEGSGLPFIGEIKMVAFHYAPVGWLSCNGQLLPISEHTALFFLIGTTYGGDGQTTFGLPDLRGRMPLHSGPGYVLGQFGGASAVSLVTTQLPSHAHSLAAEGGVATASLPGGALFARDPAVTPRFGSGVQLGVQPAATIAGSGSSAAHNNLPPYLAMHFIIAIEGIFPTSA